MIPENYWCYTHDYPKKQLKIEYSWVPPIFVCDKCVEERNPQPPPIPEDALKCDFCDEPCNREWCCMKENK